MACTEEAKRNYAAPRQRLVGIVATCSLLTIRHDPGPHQYVYHKHQLINITNRITRLSVSTHLTCAVRPHRARTTFDPWPHQHYNVLGFN